MSYHIAVITSSEHGEYMQKILKDEEFPFQIHYETLNRIADLPDLFLSIQDKYDGFCTTGSFSRMTILQTYPECSKPIVAIAESVSEFYRILLNLLHKDRNCDLSRIFFDHSLWIGTDKQMSALDYIEGPAEFNEKNLKAFMGSLSLEKQLNIDKTIVKYAESLYQQGLLDLFICRHSQAYSALKKKKIPCTFVYPTRNNILESFIRLYNELNLIRLGDNLPGVIYLSSRELLLTGPEDVTVESISLQKCLLDYDQENTAGILIKKAAGGFEMYTTRHTLQRLTDQFSNCSLSKYLLSRLGRDFHIGYGIGTDIISARSHALKSIEFSQKSGQSYLIDETDALIGPMSASETDPSAQEHEAFQIISEKSGLSSVTLQRIKSAIELIGRNEITTQELAEALKVTVANANRFMNQLFSSGYAIVIGEKKAINRGRPTRIYQIHL